MQREQWEQRWKDYYQILGLDPGASDVETRDAFRYKAQILHPDRLAGVSPRTRERAERDFREVTEAYEVLRDPRRRRPYHAAWLRRQGPAVAPQPAGQPSARPHFDRRDTEPAGKRGVWGTPNWETSRGPGRNLPPCPVIDPPFVSFNALPPGHKVAASFVVTNAGGKWSSLRFRRSPAPWLTLVRRRPIGTEGELPMRVELEVDASQMPSDARMAGTIEVWLDDQIARLPVRVRTTESGRTPADAYQRSAEAAVPDGTEAPAVPADTSTGRGLRLGFWAIVFLFAWAATLGAFAVQALFPSPQTARLGETTLEGLAVASIVALAVWTVLAYRRTT